MTKRLIPRAELEANARAQQAFSGLTEEQFREDLAFKIDGVQRLGFLAEEKEKPMSEQVETRSSKAKAKPAGPKSWTEQLDVKMTEKELAELAPRIDSAIAEVEVLEEQKKSAALVWKSKIELAEERVRELRVFAASGKKKADVKVEERLIFETNSAEVWRLDTNEKIRFRALGLEERQTALPLLGEPLTATVAEVAGAKRGRKAKAPLEGQLEQLGQCQKASAKGEPCTRPAGHRGAHGYAGGAS